MKGNKSTIGILFNFSSQWMGGIIYVINIVNTLDFLKDEEKPEIILFYNPSLRRFLPEFNYPYLTCIEWDFPSIIKGNLLSILKRKNVFIDEILKKYKLDSLFPMHDFPVRTITNTRLISWWADLQEKYYPEFFTPIQRASRHVRILLILKNCNYMVLSSNAVLDDFNSFYNLRGNMKVSVFHFVSVIKDSAGESINGLRAVYGLPDKYFLVSNQFHKHKNHRIILLALARLKALGIRKHVAFTGKLPAAQDSQYLAELHAIMNDHNLHDQVTMLGLIPRTDQITIMKHCQAVIQPSLFEGWSTVIEDAKSLQVPVVAANLKVNIEQLSDQGVYFDPNNTAELATILDTFPERNIDTILYEGYSQRIKNAADQLRRILG